MGRKTKSAVLALSVLLVVFGGQAVRGTDAPQRADSPKAALQQASVTVPGPEEPLVVQAALSSNTRGWTHGSGAAPAADQGIRPELVDAYTLAVALAPTELPPLPVAAGSHRPGRVGQPGRSTDRPRGHRVVPGVLGPVLDGSPHAAIPDTDDGQVGRQPDLGPGTRPAAAAAGQLARGRDGPGRRRAPRPPERVRRCGRRDGLPLRRRPRPRHPQGTRGGGPRLQPLAGLPATRARLEDRLRHRRHHRARIDAAPGSVGGADALRTYADQGRLHPAGVTDRQPEPVLGAGGDRHGRAATDGEAHGERRRTTDPTADPTAVPTASNPPAPSAKPNPQARQARRQAG